MSEVCARRKRACLFGLCIKALVLSVFQFQIMFCAQDLERLPDPQSNIHISSVVLRESVVVQGYVFLATRMLFSSACCVSAFDAESPLLQSDTLVHVKK